MLTKLLARMEAQTRYPTTVKQTLENNGQFLDMAEDNYIHVSVRTFERTNPETKVVERVNVGVQYRRPAAKPLSKRDIHRSK